MTDTPPWSAAGAGEGQGPDLPPWFPPAGPAPGPGYGPPPGYGQPGYGQPGYGSPPGGWSAPPQAPKPGVIPLRPIAVGEILDGAFTSIRRNPKATLGITGVVLTISAVITTGLEIVLSNHAGSFSLPSAGQTLSQAQMDHMLRQLLHYFATVLLPTVAVSLVLSFVVRIILTGLLTAVIGRSVLGHRITAGEAWQIALPRLLSLFFASLLTLAAIIVPLFVLVGLLAALGFAGAPAGVLVALGVPGFLAWICLSIWFGVMFSMSAPVVVLEREDPVHALARSWRLVRRSFWRVFGILLLAGLIVAVAGSILTLPFSFLSGAFTGLGGPGALTHALHPSMASRVISALGGIVAGTLTAPITAGVTVLLYVDLRMRREGLDLVLQTATGGGQMPGDEFATMWRPSGSGAGAATNPSPPAAGAPPAW